MFKIIYKDDFLCSHHVFDNTFFVRINGQAFPGEGWTDFSAEVLVWWIDEVLGAQNEKALSFRLRFMDGPYYIHCLKKGENIYLEAIEDRARKKVAAEGMIPVAELISEIEKAAHAIAAAAGEHGLGGEPGVARLRAALERLKM